MARASSRSANKEPAAATPTPTRTLPGDVTAGQPREPERPREPARDSKHGHRPGRQSLERPRLEPQDQPPADVLDDENIAGEKDFELRPPP